MVSSFKDDPHIVDDNHYDDIQFFGFGDGGFVSFKR